MEKKCKGGADKRQQALQADTATVLRQFPLKKNELKVQFIQMKMNYTKCCILCFQMC